jgi:phosphotriesterase-related protein
MSSPSLTTVGETSAQAAVETATGPVQTAELGQVLMHEHVLTASPGLRADYPGTFPRARVLETCVIGLRALKAAGIDTLVDHTTYDLGRDALLLAEASRASGVNLVVATGVWVDPQRFWRLRAPVATASLLISDIQIGIAGTGIRGGVIKCATDRAGMTTTIERVLRACAIAHRETGVYISTHTVAAYKSGLDQQRIFRDEGVDLSRVVIGHSGDTDDLDYLHQLLSAGSYIGLDRFGVEDILDDSRRMDVVATLCQEGYEDRLILSQDASFWTDMVPIEARLRAQPNWHHRHIVEDIVPGLISRGVRQEQIETMLVRNPAALLTPSQSYPGTPTAASRAHGWD